MALPIIRHPDEHNHARLRTGAAEPGRSVEAAVRAIDEPGENFLLALHATMSEVGGVHLTIPVREDRLRPIEFS